ncbi:hypothetical protein SPB21_01700 [Leptothoe sp. ISB3NOV94-8A]
MSNNAPLLIESENLSHAWANLFLKILEAPKKEVSTVLISLTNFEDNKVPEALAIRESLDNCLTTIDEQSVHTVSNTIFPENLWRLTGLNRHSLFEKYIHNFPRIKALAACKNNRGTYFKRLIEFDNSSIHTNQLEHIISEYNSRPGVRRAMFQASIFDPRRDHTRSARLGFPCLQHLQFTPNTQDKKLTVNAYYATQQILEKAYGNYLGICRLGHFMAHEMHLSLDRVNFFIGVAKLRSNKKDSFIIDLQERVRDATTVSNGR